MSEHTYNVRTLVRFDVDSEATAEQFFPVAYERMLNISMFGQSLNFGKILPFSDELEAELQSTVGPLPDELVSRLEAHAREAWGTDTAPTSTRRMWFTKSHLGQGVFFKCAGQAPLKWFRAYCEELRKLTENQDGNWTASMYALDEGNDTFNVFTYSKALPELTVSTFENGSTVQDENRVICSLRLN